MKKKMKKEKMKKAKRKYRMYITVDTTDPTGKPEEYVVRWTLIRKHRLYRSGQSSPIQWPRHFQQTTVE